MTADRRGIAAIGTWIMDHVRVIDVWPEEQTLANILHETFSGGGLAHNVAVDIAKFGLGIPVEGVGYVGDDDDGRSILASCAELGIDCSHIGVTAEAPTSYTEVMSVQATGKRTFFHSRGANNRLNYSAIPYTSLRSRIAHVGYLLLMDGMDAPDQEFGTVAAKALHGLQEQGIRTSVDTVSENSERFRTLIPPALHYVDYIILNEFEAGQTTGCRILVDDRLDVQALRSAARALIDLGNSELVVIHMAAGAYTLTRDGAEHFQPAFLLPAGYVQGSAGAGDAFCAGVLVGLHEGWDLEEGLRFGTAAAAASLSDPTTTGGVRSYAECMALFDRYPLQASVL